MGKVRTSAFSVSIDGFGAAVNQSLDNPFGQGGMALPGWMLKTRMFHAMRGQEGGSTGVDDGFASRSMENIGAWIMGRNMFGPIRGPWPDDTWKGWWVVIRHTTRLCMYSPITRAGRSRWKVAL